MKNLNNKILALARFSAMEKAETNRMAKMAREVQTPDEFCKVYNEVMHEIKGTARGHFAIDAALIWKDAYPAPDPEAIVTVARMLAAAGIGYAEDGETPGCVSAWAYSCQPKIVWDYKSDRPFSIRFSAGAPVNLEGLYLDCVGYLGLAAMIVYGLNSPPNETLEKARDLSGIVLLGGCYNWACSSLWELVKDGEPRVGDILIMPRHVALVTATINDGKTKVARYIHSSTMNNPHGVAEIGRGNRQFMTMMGYNDHVLFPLRKRNLVAKKARYALLRKKT